MSNIFSVYFNNAGYLFAGTDNGIYVCTNTISYCEGNPAEWQAFGLNTSPPRYILAIREAHPQVPLWPATTYYLAGTSDGLYRGDGQTWPPTWSPVADLQSVAISDVEVSANGQCVYAALGFIKGVTQHRGGVAASLSQGQSFFSITTGSRLHNTAISDIQLIPYEHKRLYVASYGLGAWLFNWGDNPMPFLCGL